MRHALFAVAVLWAASVIAERSTDLTASAAWPGSTETEHVTKTVAFAPGGTLRVKNFSGRVTVTGSDRQDASIDAVRRADRDRLDRIKLDVRTEGSTLVVSANEQDSHFPWYRRNNVVQTDLDIQVPRRTSLNADVFSASVTATGLEGTHRVHAFSARIR